MTSDVQFLLHHLQELEVRIYTLAMQLLVVLASGSIALENCSTHIVVRRFLSLSFIFTYYCILYLSFSCNSVQSFLLVFIREEI